MERRLEGKEQARQTGWGRVIQAWGTANAKAQRQGQGGLGRVMVMVADEAREAGPGPRRPQRPSEVDFIPVAWEATERRFVF